MLGEICGANGFGGEKRRGANRWNLRSEIVLCVGCKQRSEKSLGTKTRSEIYFVREIVQGAGQRPNKLVPLDLGLTSIHSPLMALWFIQEGKLPNLQCECPVSHTMSNE